MKKVYVYPITAKLHKIIPDSYIDRFVDSFAAHYDIVNKQHPSNKGIMDIIRYLNKIDIVFLNWIEDLPDKKGGLVQTIFFLFLTFYFKRKNIRIVWTLHNKSSHYQSHRLLKGLLFKLMLNKSDRIITLSREGLEWYKAYRPNNPEKIGYFPHPIKKEFITFKEHPAYDILIWGSIIPYKGIDIFLKYLHDSRLQTSYKILIAGKVKPVEYENEILKYCNDYIGLDNRYIPVKELKSILADARVVLFTYVGNSVLSSGALSDTLSYGMDVIAPHIGAFKDAAEDELISTYNSLDDLIPILNNVLKGPIHNNRNTISHFIEMNNWTQFSQKIAHWLH